MLLTVPIMLQFQNTLNEERFKLEGSSNQIRSCMEQFEKEHAWQDHLTQLPELLAIHSGYLQVRQLCFVLSCAAFLQLLQLSMAILTLHSEPAYAWL